MALLRYLGRGLGISEPYPRAAKGYSSGTVQRALPTDPAAL